MKILVIGSGGREHALVWKLAQSPLVEKIYCAPGNPGIAQIAACVDIAVSDLRELRRFVKMTGIDLTVVGPEAPLVAGIVNEFESDGLLIFGPTKEAAMIEGSKAFAKELMRQYRIPTAEALIFEEYHKARAYVEKAAVPIVIKADGLAAGKGAIVARTREVALQAVHRMMQDREFGDAGNRVVIEEFLEGEEVSVLCVTDGQNLCVLPAAQDHKAVFDNDEGPNTGGMGAYAPVPFMRAELLQRIEREILHPVIAAMAQENLPYRGVLYAGLMITKDGPKVVEFNCRFGDPETQAILPLIESDLAEAAWRVANGDLGNYELKIAPRWALSVVLASGGYPGSFEKGKKIEGLEKAHDRNVLIFHAGTMRHPNGELVTSGGRVLAVTGLGDDFHHARAKAYQAAEKIQFEGMHYRKDIGMKAMRHV
ncbi:MAG: phosphoribosylamine--glycine ligase [candidate division KSB1 bacterium]|nr:phosphoribosylamine--glycine ligase [candidate division KSB1 bacterium]MDZ7303421.1 phosphoribosylamine--glycine ligase [candidate division KSB1 bacterium]MDZ7312503.1 phosphoribosylamine--glycine ligase [candidate division KSB1 bacterium]